MPRNGGEDRNFDRSVLANSPSMKRLEGGALQGSPSMQSLFEKLSDNAEADSPLRIPRKIGNTKYYHLSFVEHVEVDS